MPAGTLRTRFIESRQNPHVKELRAALSRTGRTPSGLVAVEGEHLVAEAVRSHLRFATIFLREGYAQRIELSADVDHLLLPADVFASAVATEQPQGIAALVHPPAFAPERLFPCPAPLVLVLAGVQDPGNVGTLIRSAEAFAASGILAAAWHRQPLEPQSTPRLRRLRIPCSHLQRKRRRGSCAAGPA